MSVFLSAPGVCSIDWMNPKFSMVTVPDDLAYKNVVSHATITVPVKWSKWSGAGATKVEYLLDGVVYATQGLVAADGTQTGAIDLVFSKGGKFNLQVRLLNDAGATLSSNSYNLVIADTLGSHLDPLPMNINASRFPCKMRNKQFQQNSGKVVSAYAIDWSVYRLHGMDYYVNNIPGDNLTHLFFCFLGIVGRNESYQKVNPTGYDTMNKVIPGLTDFEVFVPDPWAAYQKPVGTQVNTDAVKGCYGELMAFGKRYPNVKKIVSIGGWTLSDPFFFMDVDANRAKFISSLETFLRTWKFWDGIDLDWEFPGVGGATRSIARPDVDQTTYLKLVKELRVMLDRLGAEFGKRYEMTIAINAVPDKLAPMNYGEIAKSVDYVNVMSYAFHGAWDNQVISHHTNVYPPDFRKADYTVQNYSCRREIDDLVAQGVPKSKLVLGAVTFGRGWSGVPDAQGTDVFLGKGVAGKNPGPKTEQEKYWLGVSLAMYSHIVEEMTPANGWDVRYDTVAEAPFVYKKETGDLLTYDNPRSVAKKCQIVMEEGLAGIFSWKMDTDNGDILNTMNEGMGNTVVGSNGVQPLNVSTSGNVSANANSMVTLSATSDNPNSGTLTYVWKQLKGTSVTLVASGVDGIVQFTAPTLLAGEVLDFQVTVTDGKAQAVIKTVTITVLSNRAPTANAGVAKSVVGGSTVSLTGTAVDADNNAMTYLWTQVSGQSVTLVNAGQLSASFVAPVVTADTPLVFKLSVTDGVAVAVVSQVTITITAKEVTGGSTYPAYVAGKQYNAGDKVGHGGFDWQANYWTQNVTPSRTVGDWKLLTAGTLPWDMSVAYNANDLCSYNGVNYKALYWTKGDVPGVVAVWVKQ